ncbi:MAG: cation:proton antiporter [Candidatus Omnitrophica bacterium]|nr:cation:proton antiporter [Candidatus Omnitrophota bacterium]
MNGMLLVGLLILVGFLLGEAAQRFKLPKVTGYILAGVLMNPQICPLVPPSLPTRTNGVESLALAFITFSIGGSLFFPTLKKLGKGIFYITILEAEMAFFAIVGGFLLVLPFLAPEVPRNMWFTYFIPASLLLGCLGSPTDPSVAMAVGIEYKAKGEVSSTMLSVAALDDVTGIMNYSIAVVAAQTIIAHERFSAAAAFLTPAYQIFGAIFVGIVFGLILNFTTKWIKKETEGVLIVVLLSALAFCYGTCTFMKVDELLATMTMGVIVVNFNAMKESIFKLLERYLDDLIFVVFFTLSGMHINISVIPKAAAAIVLFVIFRLIGKYLGTAIGARLAGSSAAVKKYVAGGLVPQGGIVIGLALLMQQNPAFKDVADLMLSVVVGSVIINELMGPIITKSCLKGAGEI